MSAPAAAIASAASCGPIAEQRPHKVVFGAVKGENRGKGAFPVIRTRNDPWFWLRDDERKNPEVLAHLRKENEHCEQETKHLSDLRDTLYKEHISHLKETDDNPPYRRGSFFYYTRTVQGKSYKIHCRKPAEPNAHVPSEGAEEEVLLDENELAKDKKHCDIRSVRTSPDHRRLAYAVDYNGEEVYQIVVVDLATKAVVSSVKQATGQVVWASDTRLYYLTQDATKRPYKLWCHEFGREADALVFEEKDEMFWLGASKSRSGRFVFVESGSRETSECHFIDLQAGDAAAAPLVCVQPRTFGLRYDVDHDGRDSLLIWSNKDECINQKLLTAPLATPGQEHWTEVIPYAADRKIDFAMPFRSHIVLQGRQFGLTQLWLLDVSEKGVQPDSLRVIPFEEELFEVGCSTNREFDTPWLRIHYSSLTTPTRWLDLDMRVGAAPRDVLIKEQPVLEFDRTRYVCKRMFATAADKTKIPMSLVYRKDLFATPGAKPLHLYAYGSYGISIDPGFHRLILPYLDRGMVYCIAHIRGGGEMGRFWYEEQGKYLTKRNTFSDFVSCAEHLCEENVTAPHLMSCEGRSAGGLLIGNVINMRPDLFAVAIAGVPFVDLMNTMCDPSIPLTTNEWEEWGNPNTAKYFDYMLSYSPYDNVREQPYPNVLITAGLFDPRVAYWEPAKWASKLRTMKTGSNQILAKFDLDSGHFSASDRYKYIKEKSWEQAYVLDKLGLAAAKVEWPPSKSQL